MPLKTSVRMKPVVREGYFDVDAFARMMLIDKERYSTSDKQRISRGTTLNTLFSDRHVKNGNTGTAHCQKQLQ